MKQGTIIDGQQTLTTLQLMLFDAIHAECVRFEYQESISAVLEHHLRLIRDTSLAIFYEYRRTSKVDTSAPIGTTMMSIIARVFLRGWIHVTATIFSLVRNMHGRTKQFTDFLKLNEGVYAISEKLVFVDHGESITRLLQYRRDCNPWVSTSS
jgi:hypothetical protein